MNALPAPATGIPAGSLNPTVSDRTSRATRILQAAKQIMPFLERGRPIGASDLRPIMTHAFDGSDAEGCWVWKDAYEACEAAQVLFLRKFGPVILGRSQTPAGALAMLA
ncbi:MAG: methylase/helicase, partial [Mesorhizobium sp.]